MTKRLSHSQVNTYQTCAKKYDFHYNHRLRESVTSAALLFGTALDNTLNPMLLDLKSGNLKLLKHYQELVTKNWETGKINDSYHKLPECLLIAYADSDFDQELISESLKYEEDCLIEEKYPHLVYETLAEQKKMRGIENLPEYEAKFINLMNWFCLRRKAELMVKSYYEQVLPKIVRVIDVQVKIELTNDNGDTVIGYIDAILDFGDGPRIVDNKTAARAYEDGAANISPQLAIYAYSKDITKTAFVVLSKQIKKNRTKICSSCNHNGTGSRAKTCDNEIPNETKIANKVKLVRCGAEWLETLSPEATVEILFGDVNPVFQNNVVDNYEETLSAINAGAYPRNFSACHSYGRKCPYFSLCHEGTGEEKLVKV